MTAKSAKHSFTMSAGDKVLPLPWQHQWPAACQHPERPQEWLRLFSFMQVKQLGILVPSVLVFTKHGETNCSSFGFSEATTSLCLSVVHRIKTQTYTQFHSSVLHCVSRARTKSNSLCWVVAGDSDSAWLFDYWTELCLYVAMAKSKTSLYLDVKFTY